VLIVIVKSDQEFKQNFGRIQDDTYFNIPALWTTFRATVVHRSVISLQMWKELAYSFIKYLIVVAIFQSSWHLFML